MPIPAEDEQGRPMGTSHRHPEWRKRLAQMAEAELDHPFDWKDHNCGHLMAAGIIACREQDDSLAFLTNGLDEAGVKEHLRTHGGLEKILDDHFATIPQLRATDGDIGILKLNGVTMGCLILNGQGILRSDSGTKVAVRTVELAKVYRV